MVLVATCARAYRRASRRVRTGDFKRQIGSRRGLILTDSEAEPGGVGGGAAGVGRGEVHELGRLDVLIEQGVVVLLFLLVLRVSRRDPHAALNFLTGPDCRSSGQRR
jgi:ClpP class serine protease